MSLNSFDYSDSLLVESAFIPMSFLENRDTGSMQIFSENDWAYIKYANSTEEKYGYFGMEYNDSYQMSLTCMGYPALIYPINFNYEYRIRLIYSSDVFTTFYNSFRSNIDVSSGNSGGPCFYENQGLYIVRAITSSGDDYFNYFCKINRKNFNYLGVIS